ncbi:fructose-6-phosphate aldolase [Alphaproteobacteria bacterium]|nr:fructose-6-phosphate aldolase [Alphaproteobacteria bacterium]
MKFFIDTADIEEIRDLKKTGFLDGVTTNPSLIAASGRDYKEIIAEICKEIDGPVSAEVTAVEHESMIKEGHILANLASNIAVKVPLTWEGLKACSNLSNSGIMVNVTLCFNASQAILAAKAGATFVSPFVGRLDDISQNGMTLIKDIKQTYDNYPNFKTEILVASIRDPMHIVEAAKIGAEICTIPPAVLRKLCNHPLTDIGLNNFLADWKKTGQKINKD